MLDNARQAANHESSLAELLAGNRRFVSGKAAHPHQTSARRQEVKDVQHPIALILSCSDSRVPPEILFDQGIGDLFVVRVAAHILDELVVASIEFAATKFEIPLVVVLGHSQCGAIQSTLSGEELGGHLPHVAAALQPVIDHVGEVDGDLVHEAVCANALRVAHTLHHSEPLLAELVRTGKLRIIPAHYDIASGEVTLLT